MALDNSASPSSHILIGQFKRKPPECCQKDFTKLSKTKKENFVRSECPFKVKSRYYSCVRKNYSGDPLETATLGKRIITLLFIYQLKILGFRVIFPSNEQLLTL